MDVCSALLSVSPTRKCVLKKKNKIKWKVKKRNLWVWYPAEHHLHISGPRESEILSGMVQPPSNKACLLFFPIGRDRLLYKERGGSQDKITRDVGMSLGGAHKRTSLLSPLSPSILAFVSYSFGYNLDAPPPTTFFGNDWNEMIITLIILLLVFCYLTKRIKMSESVINNCSGRFLSGKHGSQWRMTKNAGKILPLKGTNISEAYKCEGKDAELEGRIDTWCGSLGTPELW